MDYRSIIESKYNREDWQSLLHDIFGRHIAFWSHPQPVEVNASMAKEALYTGKITLPDGYIIAIYEVELSDSVVIERNRAGIRNLLCANWRGMGCAGAFMFCFRKNEAALRFSYVSESFSFAPDGSLTKQSTDTKRFTYLLGEGHRCRTAIKQFEDLKNSSLKLKAITDAFSVEALSDIFFKEYKRHYEDIIEYITGKRMVKSGNKWVEKVTGNPCAEIMEEFSCFDDPEKTVRDYVKKLMGRLVFIQFLQKKGWMGCPAGEDWTNGDKEFVQNLFAKTQYKDTFVDDVLEPLFSDLNCKRTGDMATGANYKVPYLNGGLFEEDDSDRVDFPLPAKYMSDLLDFFACYNFTIDENDTDDAEIGIDPEMLGRIFENLLEDNKDKGAFYTPKEIVDYMCRESIIAYLQNGIPERSHELIRNFVETFDASQLAEKQKLFIRKKLQAVKICDPAIGSGAFPMGLVNLLSKLYVAMKSDTDTAKMKRHIMEQNIYGVDIEQGAVDIARLRFWLAMIVEEKEPMPLPNLHFKIMQGNSLLESYKGIDLSDLTKLSKDLKYVESRGFWDTEDSEREALISSLKSYYKTSDHAKRDHLFNDIINNVRRQLFDKGITLPMDIDPSANTDFFLWHTWFSDVFANGGFDIVIGNPPYVEVVNSEEYSKYETYTCYELYAHFFERGINLLKPFGVLSFITGSLYIKGMKFGSLRKFLKSNTTLIAFRNEGDNVFEEVGMPTSTILLSKAVGESSWPFDGNALISRISSNFKQLGSLCDVQRGLEIGKKTLDPNGDIPILTGTNVKKYISKTPSYISRSVYEDNAKDEIYYLGERLVIRETGSELTVTYLDFPMYVNRSLYTFLRHKDAPSVKFLVGCLNSKLLQHFYVEKFKAPTELFPKIRIGQAKQLPIAIPTEDQDKAISELVAKAIDNSKSGHSISLIEKEIDFLIYKLYGLSYDEILSVDPETTITEEEYNSHE